MEDQGIGIRLQGRMKTTCAREQKRLEVVESKSLQGSRTVVHIRTFSDDQPYQHRSKNRRFRDLRFHHRGGYVKSTDTKSKDLANWYKYR
jgi:hypothetical protein